MVATGGTCTNVVDSSLVGVRLTPPPLSPANTAVPYQAECCGIMGVVSTEHATGNDPASDARALLLEVRQVIVCEYVLILQQTHVVHNGDIAGRGRSVARRHDSRGVIWQPPSLLVQIHERAEAGGGPRLSEDTPVPPPLAIVCAHAIAVVVSLELKCSLRALNQIVWNACLDCQGLAVLRNRGYDSAGMATSSESGLMVSKYASRGERFRVLHLALYEVDVYAVNHVRRVHRSTPLASPVLDT